jgi:asparagine synthase (glutamine-hydrolysing)
LVRISENRKKAGFLIPLERWVRHEWQPILRENLTENFAVETEAFRWAALERMIDAHATGQRDFAYPLFALLTLSFWWRYWIRGETLATDANRGAAITRIERLGSDENVK